MSLRIEFAREEYEKALREDERERVIALCLEAVIENTESTVVRKRIRDYIRAHHPKPETPE